MPERTKGKECLEERAVHACTRAYYLYIRRLEAFMPCTSAILDEKEVGFSEVDEGSAQ